ncbi:MAG: TIGR02611 family protein [Actinomycetes bacterium]
MRYDDPPEASGAVPVPPAEPQVPRPRRVRARHFIRRRRTLNQAYRLAVAIFGSAVTVAGVAMLALPGPGWAAIFVGLAILATEYHWARRLLHRAHMLYEKAKERTLDPKVRRRNQILGAVAAVVVALGAVWWVRVFGVPFL